MADTTLTRGEVAVGSAGRGKAGRARRFWNRLYDRLRRHSISVYALVLSFILFLLVLAPQIFVNVPAGYVGVLWLRFFGGTVTTSHLDEGLHVIFPWDEVYLYDARLQNRARVYDTISSNGLSMQVEIAIRYRINRDTVGLLHQQIGPNYDEVLVYPEIGSHARELISRYTPEQLYSETRAFIQAQLLERMVTQLGASLGNQSLRGRLVDVEDVLIRSVNLPTRVQDAIERKAEQYQAMLEYDFRLAREKKEAERKKIEADGIREFQDTVARTITPEYLRLRGIEATMTLAASPNSKIIVVGGKDGLPLILNTADEPSSRPALPTGSGAAPSGTDTLQPSPPNAKLDDVAPTNAAVPLNLPASSPTGAPADLPQNKDAVSSSREGTADPAVSEQGSGSQPDSTTLSAPDTKAPASP